MLQFFQGSHQKIADIMAFDAEEFSQQVKNIKALTTNIGAYNDKV